VALSFLNYPALGAILLPSIEITGPLITHMAPSVAVLVPLRNNIKMVLLVINTLTGLPMFGGARSTTNVNGCEAGDKITHTVGGWVRLVYNIIIFKHFRPDFRFDVIFIVRPHLFTHKKINIWKARNL
jgi:hypothetical protein